MGTSLETSAHFLLDADLEGIVDRISKYKEKLLSADLVVVTLVCSDSRVVLPIEPITVTMTDGSMKTMIFVGVATIGGGAPSRSRLRGVTQTLVRWGVPKEKLNVLVTQHSERGEIESASSHGECRISCGLRKFFSEHSQELSDIRERLVFWTREYKRKTKNKFAAPDRLELELLQQQAPDVMSLVNRLHTTTGLPRRLIIRAGYRNSSFDIKDNLVDIWERMTEYLSADEYEDMFASCIVAAAYYDHQTKELDFDLPNADLQTIETHLQFEQLPSRTDSVQKPKNVIISFGEDSICLHNGVLLPHFAGSLSEPDNVFRACASIPSVPTVLCAFSEAFYAVVHKVHPHKGDENFSTLERVIIVCDSDQHERVVKDALHSKEFQEDFAQTFAQLNQGELVIVNLHADQLGKKPTWKTLVFAA